MEPHKFHFKFSMETILVLKNNFPKSLKKKEFFNSHFEKFFNIYYIKSSKNYYLQKLLNIEVFKTFWKIERTNC